MAEPKEKLSHPSWYGGMLSERRAVPTPLPELSAYAELIRKICRQMCVDDGVDPDGLWVEAYGKEFKNYEHHSANVNAVLRALKAIAS